MRDVALAVVLYISHSVFAGTSANVVRELFFIFSFHRDAYCKKKKPNKLPKIS